MRVGNTLETICGEQPSVKVAFLSKLSSRYFIQRSHNDTRYEKRTDIEYANGKVVFLLTDPVRFPCCISSLFVCRWFYANRIFMFFSIKSYIATQGEVSWP